MSRSPILLLLAVALFTGLVPLRRCHALDGGGSGVVPLEHGHAHDEHDAGAEGSCGCHSHSSEPATHDKCCVDTPFDAGLASESVTLALPAILPPTAWTGAGAAAAPVPVLAWARPDAPPDPLRSVRNTVLLR